MGFQNNNYNNLNYHSENSIVMHKLQEIKIIRIVWSVCKCHTVHSGDFNSSQINLLSLSLLQYK